MSKKYELIDNDEVYYIVDTSKLSKTLEDFEKEFEDDGDGDYYKELAHEEYENYLYENSLDGTEIRDALNNQDEKIKKLKKENKLMIRHILERLEDEAVEWFDENNIKWYGGDRE